MCGRTIEPSQIVYVVIYQSEKNFNELVLPNGKHVNEEDPLVMESYLSRGQVLGVFACTGRFISSPPIIQPEDHRATDVTTRSKSKVFIGHGRNVKEALELQKYLREDLKIDAKMFEDLKKESGCKTITELLEYFRDNVGYAFIIVTADDCGCFSSDLDTLKNRLVWDRKKTKVEAISEICNIFGRRGRQNVIFELGLFIGALGRERVCCLLQKDITDAPSDMDGVLHEAFDSSVTDAFVAVADKLKKKHILNS
jgi:predicted nucleotide-binding protein